MERYNIYNKNNEKKINRLLKGQRVFLDVQNAYIGKGTVLDPLYNQYYALVQWDSPSFNTNITRLIKMKNNKEIISGPVYGAIVPKSKLKKAMERCVNKRTKSFNIRNSDSYHTVYSKIEGIHKETICSQYDKNKKSTIKDDNQNNLKGIQSFNSNNLMENRFDKLKKPKKEFDSKKDSVNKNLKMSKPIKNISINEKMISEREKIKKNCCDGHIMIQTNSDTYDGDGVECDECQEKNIHLKKGGFYHCEVCNKVDLCLNCAKINMTKKESSKEKLEYFLNEKLENESIPEFWFILFGPEEIIKFKKNKSNQDLTDIKKKLKEKLEKNPENHSKEYFKLLKNGIIPDSNSFSQLFEAVFNSKTIEKRFLHELVIHMVILRIDPNEKTVKNLLKNFQNEKDLTWKNRYINMFRNLLEKN